MRYTSKLFLLLLLLCASFVVETRADIVTVTGGSAMTGGVTGGPFTLTGEGFSLSGAFNYANQGACSPCTGGQVLNFGAYNTGSDVRSGSGTISGTYYDRLFYDAALRFSGSLNIPVTDAASLTLYAPFAFEGTMNACRTSTVSGCQGGYVFSAQLAGQGIATVMLSGFLDPGTGTRLFNISSVTYNFAAQPVPEPATLLLLSTGLAGAAAAARRRRRMAHSASDAA